MIKIYVTDIAYDITDEDVEANFDAYLEITDLVNYTGEITTTDLNNIIIDKSIYDAFQTDFPILVGYADGWCEIVYLYQMDREDDNNIYAHLCNTYSYKELADNIKENLDAELEFTVTPEEIADMEEEELDYFISELISNKTDFLISGFDYEINEV